MHNMFNLNRRLRPNRKSSERHYREMRFLYSDFIGNADPKYDAASIEENNLGKAATCRQQQRTNLK